MKPLFKWASSSPWTEMQLQALSAPDYATALQQIWKAVWGLVWFAVLARVLGFLMYRHYLLRCVPLFFCLKGVIYMTESPSLAFCLT